MCTDYSFYELIRYISMGVSRDRKSLFKKKLSNSMCINHVQHWEKMFWLYEKNRIYECRETVRST